MYKDPEQFRESHTLHHFWLNVRKDKVTLISLYLFLFILFLVFFGHLIAPYEAQYQAVGMELLPPSWDKNGQISYFLGTDDLGRDIFSRLLYGFYYTVGSALIVTLAVALIGGAMGVIAGLNRGKRWVFLSHLFDTFLFIPALLISIIVASLMEASLLNAMLAIFLATLPHFIHRIYQATQAELAREYVVTLILDGATKKTLVKETILPNLTTVAVRESTTFFTFTILDITALSFIALGAKSPTPEWGAMIRDAFELIYIAPWTVILPGFAIITVILISTVLGRGLERVLEKYRYY